MEQAREQSARPAPGAGVASSTLTLAAAEFPPARRDAQHRRAYARGSGPSQVGLGVSSKTSRITTRT
eukprot:15476081-Alexandrium_andersonii.AAC.1